MRGMAAIPALAVVVLLSGCDGIPGTPKAKALASVRSMMVDPKAAQFSNVVETREAVCGTVNGKNRMGAYSGASPFIFDKLGDAAMVYPGAPSSYDIMSLADGRDGNPSWSEDFQTMTAVCGFPAKWSAACGSPFPLDERGDFCRKWREDGPQAALDSARR